MAKRRANGEGNLRKRKDGRWEGRYTAGHDPETGKAIYKNVLGRTQAEAKAKLKTAIEETKVLDVTKVGKYTVGAWMDEWFENYTKVKVRPSSHQTYRGYIDNHIKPNIGKIQLEKLTSLELQKLYKKLLTSGRIDRIESKHQAKGLSPKTVRNIHQIITSAMKLAKEQKIIASDPTEGCALPKLEHREMKTLFLQSACIDCLGRWQRCRIRSDLGCCGDQQHRSCICGLPGSFCDLQSAPGEGLCRRGLCGG